MNRSEVDRNKLAPMMRHYVELKDKYEDVILFYRLGDFYEMFFDDAILVSHELELTLTGRAAGLDERVPMCGVPHHAANIYIDKLVKKGYKVAICEQLEDPKETKGMVKRDVIEVISSGTVINANSLDEKENNYIGSIYDFDYCYVISYADITTGELYSQIIEHDVEIVVGCDTGFSPVPAAYKQYADTPRDGALLRGYHRPAQSHYPAALYGHLQSGKSGWISRHRPARSAPPSAGRGCSA